MRKTLRDLKGFRAEDVEIFVPPGTLEEHFSALNVPRGTLPEALRPYCLQEHSGLRSGDWKRRFEAEPHREDGRGPGEQDQLV